MLRPCRSFSPECAIATRSSPSLFLLSSAGLWFPDRTDNVDVRDPTIVRRKITCAKVFAGLAEQPVRLLRAPPGSGKTALGRLLIAAAPPGRKVVSLNVNELSASGLSVEAFWKDATGDTMWEALRPRHGPLRTYIVDEVQLLYSLGPDAPFWRAVKAIASTDPADCRVQLMLMGTFGLQGSKLVGTPIELRNPWSLKLLLLDEAEVSELFGAFNSTCRAQGYPAVSRSLQLAMERVCGRHVGLLRAAMRLFMTSFKGKETVTFEEEAEFCSSLVCIGRDGSLRALPKLEHLLESEKVVITNVALAGPDGLHLSGSADGLPTRLVSAGILDVEDPCTGVATVLRFSSPAMRAHALFSAGVRPELALPVSKLQDAAGFVRAAIKRMRASELSGSLSKAADPKETLLERQYQMSFYSAAVALLPEGVFMSPDFGMACSTGMKPGRRGYIDFFINGAHRIGIELTRDGKDLEEHAARFNTMAGIYVPLNLKTWVVVDFRKTAPSTTKATPGTVFVVFSKNFERATIMQEGLKDEVVALAP